MAQEATDTTDILALLKVNNQGWSIGLFQDQHALQSSICSKCKCVCCEAVELGCDHDDDDIFLYCKSCLMQLIDENDNKCPIDKHNDPTISPNRALRRQISKSMTYCPYSSAYKSEHQLSHKNDDNQIMGGFMDTLGGDNDEKEGNPQGAVAQPVAYNPPSSHGCQWQGTLNDLIHEHMAACLQKNDPSYALRIKVKDLQHENAQLKQRITELKSTQKAQIIALQNQINEYAEQLQQKQTKMDQLKTENKQSLMIIQALNENVTAMENEVGLQSFQNTKLEQKTTELKTQIAQYQSQLKQKSKMESSCRQLDAQPDNSSENKQSQMTTAQSFSLENMGDSLFEDVARFLRTLPPKSKQHIWEHGVKIQTPEGKKVGSQTRDKDQINKLLCDCVIVYVKYLDRNRAPVSGKRVRPHMENAAVYIQKKYHPLLRDKFENDKSYFAQMLQDYVQSSDK